MVASFNTRVKTYTCSVLPCMATSPLLNLCSSMLHHAQNYILRVSVLVHYLLSFFFFDIIWTGTDNFGQILFLQIVEERTGHSHAYFIYFLTRWQSLTAPICTKIWISYEIWEFSGLGFLTPQSFLFSFHSF